MKKTSKFISLILAIVMVFSTLSIAASAAAIKNDYDTVEKLISINSIGDLLDYLVNNINSQKDILITPVLRIVFLAMNNEDINGYIGTKDVTKLSGDEASKILVKWLDEKILPDLNSSIASSSAIQIINEYVPGLNIDISSVQNTFNTVSDIDNYRILVNRVGDVKDLNIDAIKNAPSVSGHEAAAVKAVVQFLKDNLGIVKKVLNGTLNLDVTIAGAVVTTALTDMVKENIGFIGQLPQLLKSFLYKLIDKDAAAGEFADGKMGGDWAKSPYASYTADQLLAAALIKAINQNDEIVEKSAADEVLNLSFYGILTKYGPVLYEKFAVSALNDHLQDWIDAIPGEARNEFVQTVPTLTADTFKDIFTGAEESGFLGQLNNFLVKVAEMVLTSDTFKKVALEKGDNTKLNDNLTKIARYALPILFKLEDTIGYTFPEEIKNADPATLTLPQMATYILKPFFSDWFTDSTTFSKDVVNAADSLPALAVLAVNYTASNASWKHWDYTPAAVSAADIKNISEDDATDLALATGAGIGIGAIKEYKDTIHFADANSLDANWEKAFIQIENWGLDFISGLPAAARVHDLKNANSYGPFYKLNVILNELIDFSFLNDVNDITFKLDLETLLRSVLAKAYKFDVAGVIGIFEKNSKSGNILAGKIVPSVIGVVNRILTALFEHNCGSHKTDSKTKEDPKDPCTKEIKTDYEFCSVCGAYFSRSDKTVTKTTPTHKYGPRTTKNSDPDDNLIGKNSCNYKIVISETCTICGNVHVLSDNTASHDFEGSVCKVCGYDKNATTPDKPDDPKPPVEDDVKLGDVNEDGKVNAADARLALRKAVGLETYEPGSKKFKACDVNKDGKVNASDARKILRVAVGLDKTF